MGLQNLDDPRQLATAKTSAKRMIANLWSSHRKFRKIPMFNDKHIRSVFPSSLEKPKAKIL